MKSIILPTVPINNLLLVFSIYFSNVLFLIGLPYFVIFTMLNSYSLDN